jgi:type VI secretion system secreted protein VgrG
MQTATVVGIPGENEVFTDEMGRIKVQFHWQRKKEHPEYGANRDDRSSCWLRVFYPSAGEGWGHQFIPRIGHEVAVNFIENDIDRPIITNAAHNGRHPPPWFSGAGQLPGNRALSGIKTKEHNGNQYNELLFDDTQGEVRAKLSSEHGKTQLNQGYLTHPRRNGAAEPRGDGFELRTDRAGAIRAAEGLLISTENSANAEGRQLDRLEVIAQIESTLKYVKNLADIAAQQLADAMETGPARLDDEGHKQQETDKGHLDHIVETLKAWEAGTNTDPEGKSATKQRGRQALIALSAPDGIALSSPEEIAITTNQNLYTASLRDTQQSTQRRWIHNVGGKISLFVHGIVGRVSMKLIAAKGHIKLWAQSGDIEIIADKSLRFYASKENLIAAAEQELSLHCKGAYICMKDGNIEIHAPGKISIKGEDHSLSGPTRLDIPPYISPESQLSLETPEKKADHKGSD